MFLNFESLHFTNIQNTNLMYLLSRLQTKKKSTSIDSATTLSSTYNTDKWNAVQYTAMHECSKINNFHLKLICHHLHKPNKHYKLDQHQISQINTKINKMQTNERMYKTNTQYT